MSRTLSVLVWCLALASSAHAGLFKNDTYQVGPVAFSFTVPEGYVPVKAEAEMGYTYSYKNWYQSGLLPQSQKVTERVPLPLTADVKAEGGAVRVVLGPGTLDPREKINKKNKPYSADYRVTVEFKAPGGARQCVRLDYFTTLPREGQFEAIYEKRLERKITDLFDGLFVDFRGDSAWNKRTDVELPVEYAESFARASDAARVFERLHGAE